MDKSVVLKILLGVAFLTTKTYIFAENIPAQKEKKSEEDEQKAEENFEPMKELPELQQICPDLDRALDTSMGKFKSEKVKIVDPVFKTFNIGIEMASLCKDLWFLIAQRKSKNKDYNFDYHGRLGTVWKYNIYIGGDFGYSTGKDCIWEENKENKSDQDKKEDKKLEALNKKYEHLSKGPYMNLLLGYDYHFNDNNSLIIAGKFACAWTTIKKSREGEEDIEKSLTPCWLGILLASESKIFSSPVYWGCDLQMNFLLNKKKIDNVENYYIPDYGHSDYKVNFGFNLFLGIKLDLGGKIITP